MLKLVLCVLGGSLFSDYIAKICEIKMGSSEFLRGEFQSWIPQKSLESSQSMVQSLVTTV